MKLSPSGVSLVAGSDITGGGQPFTAIDPQTGAALDPSYHAISHEQLDSAVTAAVQASHTRIDHATMGAALDAAAEAFEASGDAVVASADAETALGRTRLEGELARTIGQLRMMATEARAGTRRDRVSDPAGDGPAAPALLRTTVPLGVVGVFAASNFPLAFGVAGTDTAAALGAGCPVVAKAHPAQPATAELCGRLIAAGLAAAELHPGFFSVVHEQGTDIGQALTLHDGVDAVAFTGSHVGGRALFDLAASRDRPIPVYAEMGSMNPLFVSPGAAAERAEQITQGIFGSYLQGEGQFCTKPGLIILPDTPGGGHVLDGLLRLLDSRSPAHPLLHDGIKTAFAKGAAAAADIDGVVAFHAPAADAGGQAVLLQATVKALMDHPALRQELFGPAAVVVQASDAEMRDIGDVIDPALTATLHFTPAESDWAASMADQLARKVGRVIADGYPTGVRVSPAQHHGGPYPATTSPLHTSVGLAAIDRFLRPVTFQNFDSTALPGWARPDA